MEAPRPYSGDWLLHSMTRMLAKAGGGESPVSITLFLGGTIVMGHPISHEHYLKKTAEKITSLFKDKDEWDQVIVAQYRRMGIQLDDSDRLADSGEEDPGYATGFIHLNKVVFCHDGKAINADLWRGRIEEVDGFTLGSFRL